MPAPAVAAAPAAPGFYGKLPARGDFVGRRLGRGFVDAWDSWLQEAIHASRAELGAAWIDLYLNSPIWRFALSAGVCGPEAVAGVMIPSVDSVGRCFPLMVGSQLGPDIDLEGLVTGSDDWYRMVEDRILATLEPGFALELLDAAFPWEPARAAGPSPGGETLSPAGWYFPAEAGGRMGPAVLDRLRGARPPVSIWWTDGSEHVAPCCILHAGLPSPGSFASMLDGRWRNRHWMTVPGHLNGGVSPDQEE